MTNIERIRFLLWLGSWLVGMVVYLWKDFQIEELKQGEEK